MKKRKGKVKRRHGEDAISWGINKDSIRVSSLFLLFLGSYHCPSHSRQPVSSQRPAKIRCLWLTGEGASSGTVTSKLPRNTKKEIGEKENRDKDRQKYHNVPFLLDISVFCLFILFFTFPSLFINIIFVFLLPNMVSWISCESWSRPCWRKTENNINSEASGESKVMIG